VLLCRRAIQPRRGFWTLPAGFMENGETMEQAARRETWEEACARVNNLQLYTLFDLPHINQVYLFFRAELADLDFAVGVESLEVQLFDESAIPWTELAFPTVGRTLECFFADRLNEHFPVRNEPVEALLAHYKKG
jgi:ADP-ribose pyrophosphatase YjhB (NUDIX family)